VITEVVSIIVVLAQQLLQFFVHKESNGCRRRHLERVGQHSAEESPQPVRPASTTVSIAGNGQNNNAHTVSANSTTAKRTTLVLPPHFANAIQRAGVSALELLRLRVINVSLLKLALNQLVRICHGRCDYFGCSAVHHRHPGRLRYTTN
jgi:hypothetical protein